MKKNKNILFFLSILSIFETLVFFCYLIKIPSDPKNSFILGFSPNRIFLLFLIILILLISCLLFVILAKNSQVWFLRKLERTVEKHPIISLIVGLIIIIGAWGSSYFIWLLLHDKYFVVIDRVLPVVLLYLLFITQLIVYFLMFNKYILRIINWFYYHVDDKKTGLSLLLVSLLLGLFTINITFYNHTDEGDVLSVGWLISEGYVLYKDIFSHHFPLPYYWVGLIIKIFGSSITILRCSLLFLRTIIFFVAMKNSQYYLSLGLSALTWSVISFLYLGNMLLYDSFAGMFLIVAFAISLSCLNNNSVLSDKNLLIIGFTLSFAFLSDPTKVFPGIVIVIAVVIKIFRDDGIFDKFVWKKLIHLIISGLVPILILFLILVLSQTIENFRLFVFEFNSNVYQNYSGHIRLSFFINQIKTGLEILSKNWIENLNPMYSWNDFLGIDRSIFTGLFYRITIWFSIFFYLFRKKYLSAIMIFFFLAANLIRAREAFHASPFVLISVFLAFLIIEEILILRKTFVLEVYTPISLKNNFSQFAYSLILFSLILNLFWLNFRGVDYYLKNQNDYTYNGNFSRFESQAEEIQSLSCNQSDVKYLVYPVYPEVHFWGKLKPATKFIFLLPWVVDAYEEDIINELSQPQNKVIVFINKSVCIWDLYCVEDYASTTIDYLDKNYIKLSEFYYASPDMINVCEMEFE